MTVSFSPENGWSGPVPVSGTIKFFADDSYNLFINGQKIENSSDNQTDVQTLHLTDYLRTGENVIAIEVTDLDNSLGNFESVIEIKNCLCGLESVN